MSNPIDSRTDIGHVHLKVADLDRALAFYSGVLGFELTQRMGSSAAFLSAGGYHHHVGTNVWESRGASPAPDGFATLRSFAVLLPSDDARERVLERLGAAGLAAEHGAVRDPSGNLLRLELDPAS